MSALKRWDKVLGFVDVPTHDPGLAPEYLRFESLGPWMEMPKDGDAVWVIARFGLPTEWGVERDVWVGYEALDYWLGLVHPSKESAEEWITRYGAAWLGGGGS